MSVGAAVSDSLPTLGSRFAAEASNLASVSGAQDDSDEALMAAYIAGDQKAFGRLFTRYAPLLLRLGRRHLGGEDAARDLAQQTFLRLHSSRRDFNHGQRLHPWLMTIAMNLVRDQWRSRRRKPVTQLEFEPASTEGGQQLAERMGDVQSLHLALSALPQAQREVIELHWFQERPFAEVAQVIGTSEGAARVRAHRAYGRLKALLRQEANSVEPDASDS